MNDKVWRILLVDDERSLREPLATFLEAEYSFNVDTAASRAAAWQSVKETEQPYDAVLIDDMLLEDEADPEAMPIAVGIELMAQIKEHAPNTECIIFTGWSDTERGIEALRAGAYRYMSKPFDHEELAMTIQMAAQHHQLKQERALADQQKAWLQTFIKIGQATTSLHSLDEVLAEVHQQIGKQMDVSEMDIVLYDEESQTLHFELCYDRGKKQENWKRPFGNGLTEWIITRKQPLLIKHFNKEKDTLPAQAIIVFFEDENEEEITQSYLGVPLIAREKVIGLINVQSYTPDQFDETDMYVLSAIAGQVAGAIQNGRLFSDLHEARERRQALLQSSLDAIVAIDNKKHITVFNKQAEKFFGYTANEMRGEKTAILFEDVKDGIKIFDELDGNTSITERPINFKHKDGHTLPGLFSATVIYDENESPIGQAGFVRDLQNVKVLEARQQAWAEVSKAVTTSQELGDILRLIMRSVDHIIPTATGGEFHLHKDGVLQLAANTFILDKDDAAKFSLKVGQGIAGTVFATGKYQVVKDSEINTHFKKFNDPKAPKYRSLICVPLQVQDQRLGTLTVTNETVHAFREVDVPLLMPFARQAAIAIKNAQLLDEANKGLTTLKSISEASRNLIAKQKPKRVLEAIVKEAKEALKAWRAIVILVDRDGSPCELESVGYEKALKIGTAIRKNGLSVQVIKSKKPYFIEDVAKSTEDIKDEVKREGIMALACLPLKLGKEAIGVLWVKYKEPHIFTPTEKEALTIYAEQAALAYDKSRRLQEIEHMREALIALSGAADLSEILEQIVSSAREVLQADSAAIWSYDEFRHKFLLDDSVADGIKPAIWKKFKQGEPQAGQTAFTVMEQKIITIENVSDHKKYPFFGKTTKRLLKKEGIQSFLGLALTVGNEKLGVLYVNFKQLRRFTQEEISTALTFADQVALALKKAKLLEQVKKSRDTARIVAHVTTLETKDGLKAVAQGMVDAVNCDAVTFYVYDAKNDKLSYPPTLAGDFLFAEKTHREPTLPKKSIVLEILQYDDPLLIDDTSIDPRFRNIPFTKREKIKSVAAIPLKCGEEKVGVMFVNFRQHHRFTTDEYQNIQLFADQAAVIIRNGQLYGQVQRRVGMFQALHKANLAISSSMDSQKTLNAILEQAAYVINHSDTKISYACIRKVEHGISRLLATYPPDLDKKIISKVDREVKVDRLGNERIGIIGRAALTEKIQRVKDVSKNLDYRKEAPNIKSELAVPYKLRNATIVIDLQHQDEDFFTKADEKAINALAAQAAIAIENAQLYEEVQERSEFREALYKANEAISNSRLDEKATLDAILEQAVLRITKRKSKNLSHACIRAIENGISRLITTYPQELSSKIKREEIVQVTHEDHGKHLIGIMGRAAFTEKAQRVGDVSQDPDYREVDPKTKSALAVPFKLGNAVIVINIEHKEKDAYDEIDKEALEIFASQAAIAMENAQLYQKSETLREVAEALSRTIKLDDILNVVIREAMKLTNTHMGGITFWDTEKEKATDALRVEGDGKLHRYPSVARKNGMTQQIVDKIKPIIISDKRLADNPNPIYKKRGFLAEIGVPIVNRRKILGVLYIRNPEPCDFSERQIEMLETLGKHAGVAIERAQTVGFIGNKTAVEWIQMVSTTWGHSLKREVGIAKGRTELLSKLANSKDRKEFEKEIDSLKNVLERIANLPITAPLTYEDVTKAITINDLLKTYLMRQWKHDRYKEISLVLDLQPNLDKSASAWASPEWLRRGFELIIDNAVWAMEEAGTRDSEISVTTCLQDSRIKIIIENNDPTISNEVLEQFSKGLAIPKNDGDRGSGIGLQLTKTIFETYRGTIQVEKRKPQGTKVVFTLPTYQPKETDRDSNEQ